MNNGEPLWVGKCVFTNPQVKKALWEVTDFCPLHCTYCSMNSSPAGRTNFPIELAPNVLQVLRTLSVAKLVISGGEPLAYAWISELIGMCVRAGFDVSVSTSGSTLREETLRQCVEAGLRKVTVSLDGPMELHDERRGDGSFHRAMKAIELLRRLGLRITANCVVGSNDGDSIGARLSYLSSLPLQEVVICQELPRGRAQGGPTGDSAQSWRQLATAAVMYDRKPVRLLIPECDSPDCPSGMTIFHVDLYGRVRTHCIYKLQRSLLGDRSVTKVEGRL